MACYCCNSNVKLLHEGENRIDENGEWMPNRWLCENCLIAEHLGRRLWQDILLKF